MHIVGARGTPNECQVVWKRERLAKRKMAHCSANRVGNQGNQGDQGDQLKMQMDWSCLNCKYDDFYASAAALTTSTMMMRTPTTTTTSEKMQLQLVQEQKLPAEAVNYLCVCVCAGLIGEMFMWHWEFVPGHTRWLGWLAPVLVMHWNLISLLALLAAIVQQEWVTERSAISLGEQSKGEEEERQAVSLC